MKIFKLQFKNLNSLVGEWTIDFTIPEFEEQGIFAITGPTGAGKSTILDAICLALYGKTPRLEKITSGQNDIMSRQTGECFSSLEFKTNNRHYRVLWSQSKARKKADGNLQSAQHIIEDLTSNKTLEDKLSKVTDKIIEITGMDFEHFTRAMLLAQGGFAKFLHSTPDERSPILEKITGTQIYSEISQKAHERNNQEKNNLEILSQQLSGIKLLSHDEITSIKQQISDFNNNNQNLSNNKKRLETQCSWLLELEKLKNELEQINSQQTKLEIEKQLFDSDKIMLSYALKAQEINSDIYISLQEQRKQLYILQNEVNNTQNQLPELQNKYDNATQNNINSKQKLDECKITVTNNQQILQKVRILDSQIIDKNDALKNINIKFKTQQNAIQDLQLQHIKLNTLLITQQKQHTEVNQYLQLNKKNEVLITTLSGINEQLDNLGKVFFDTTKLKARMQKEYTQLTELKNKQDKLNDDYKTCESTKQKLITQLELLNTKYTTLANGHTITSLYNHIVKLNKTYIDFKELKKYLVHNQNIEAEIANIQAEIKKQNETLEKNKLLLEQSQLRLKSIADLINSLNKEQLLQSKIINLTEERDKLIVKQPCPLCGSLDHPYTNTLPINDSITEQTQQEKNNYEQLQNEITILISSLALSESEIIRLNDKYLNFANQFQQNLQIINKLESTYFIQDNELTNNITNKLITIEQQIPEFSNILEQLQKSEELIEQHKLELQKINEEVNNQNILLATTVTQIKASEDKLQLLEIDNNNLLNKYHQIQIVLLKQLKQYEINEIHNTHEIKITLRTKLDKWQEQQQLYNNLTNQMKTITHELQQNQNTQNNLLKIITQLQSELSNENTLLLNLTSERYNLFTDKNANDEEKLWNQQLQNLENEYKNAQLYLTQFTQDLITVKDRIEQNTKNIREIQNILDEQNKKFTQKLEEYGFDNENDFISKTLTRDKIIELEHQQEELKQQTISLTTLHQQTTQKILEEQTKQLTDKNYEELQFSIHEMLENIERYNQDIGKLNAKLQANEETIKSQQNILNKYNQQLLISNRFSDLHKLIGSSDGKKFRNFAQGLTFELVVKHANLQLQKMSDRYLLIRDITQPLELNVIDNYQGGEIRTTKNLSGGESFVISLALALGLSKLSSNKVQVDSLFLDEGFGTLDEDSLQTALDALDSLQQDGKLIGVISHVGILKDRISLQIQVESLSGGVSKISGVGCNNV